MGSEWVNYKVVDIANVTDYVANGSFATLKKNVTYSSVPDFAILVRLVDFNDGWNGDYVYLPEKSYRFLKKSSLDVGDVVISNVGANAGTVFRVPDLGKPATLGPNSIVIKTTGKELLRDFLYYYFSSPIGQDQIQSIITGSAQPKFNKTDFRDLNIKIPSDEHEQRAIAHILGSLDDKIELNCRMNKTLEAIARAIFKSWFIDFDPVIDNALRAGNPIPDSLAERAEIRRQILDQNQPSSPGPFSQMEKGRNYRGGFDFAGLVETSRSLRENQTSAEALLWNILRNRQFMGLKFRRQHQIGDYIADFYCHEHRLVVELDGGIHSTKQEKDAKRDAYMRSLGLTILRFPNDQVFADTESVLEKIAESINPLPMGEGLGEGSIDEIYGLFPDSFEDSELGEIPKGWAVSTIGAEFNLTMGQSPPGKTYNETGNGLPFFQGRRDFGFRFPSNRVYCTEPQRLADHGDTLVSVRAPVGDINMAMERSCIGRGVAGVRHKSGSRSYTNYAMQSLSDRFARFEVEGTVFGAINKKQFEGLRWFSPGKKKIEEFEKIAFPFDEQIENNTKESSTLASIRDTLLLKLISGELRIPDAEKFVEEVS